MNWAYVVVLAMSHGRPVLDSQRCRDCHWPAEALAKRKISAVMQERLGLDEAVMEQLSMGKYETSTVEAFALLLNRETAEVEDAFKSRSPIAGVV